MIKFNIVTATVQWRSVSLQKKFNLAISHEVTLNDQSYKIHKAICCSTIDQVSFWNIVIF